MSSNHNLFDVFVVPNFNVNLMCVHKLCKLEIVSCHPTSGTEFINSLMKSYCFNSGVVRHISCAYTPQQNRVVEIKHKNILSVARSLLFQYGVPIRV